MITLSNGCVLEHVASSGTFGYDGLGLGPKKILTLGGLAQPAPFTVVLKTLTFNPTAGNGYGAIYLLKNGLVNAVNLTNPGINWWFERISPKLEERKSRHGGLIISLFSRKTERLSLFSEMLVDIQKKMVGVELNVSCPSADGFYDWNATKIIRSCEAIKSYTTLPLVLKLSVVQQPFIKELCRQLKGLVEAFSINSVPWYLVFPGQTSPLARYGGGGVSGQAAQDINWNFAQYISNITTIPVIWPSLWQERDIARARAHGAKVFSYGAVLTLNPFGPQKWIKRDKREK